jgi:hypothetical protein
MRDTGYWILDHQLSLSGIQHRFLFLSSIKHLSFSILYPASICCLYQCNMVIKTMSGRSAAWIAHLPWAQGVGGSSPLAPTIPIEL